ncbi:MAG: type 1 glutamine amidotransferase, partial [Myxococcota bacterium]|nr:type 1 glutamine amidotransferase [Myxococcota bacterium]
FDAFTSHADHVGALPEGVPALAGNDWSPVQALAVASPGPFWAVQYHPEYDLREIGRLALLRADELAD